MKAGNSPEFLFLADGTLFGVNLSGDFTSEHESGIQSLRNRILAPEDPKVFGIDRHRIVHGDLIRWYDYPDGSAALGFFARRSAAVAPFELGFPRGGVAAAWDSYEFAVRVMKEHVEKLREIQAAIHNGDTALWVYNECGPFGGGGLVLAIVSRVPKEFLDKMAADDRERFEVMEYHRSTGIEEKLRKAGKEWFALSPQRFHEGLRKSPDPGAPYDVQPGEVAWWLNPCEQRDVRAGWWTLADLEAWARDEGPIPVKR